MSASKNGKTLVYQVQDDIFQLSHLSKLSYRLDPTYFAGKAGIIRILNLILAIISIYMMTPGYHEVNLWLTISNHHNGNTQQHQVESNSSLLNDSIATTTPAPAPAQESSSSDEDTLLIIMMMKNNGTFSGYKITYYTLASVVFGICTAVISGVFLVMLYMFMEVRCDLAWERANQRAHVLACVLSVAAAFCDVMSIQKIQEANCGTLRCKEEVYNTKNLKYEEPFYPPFFLSHYVAFVGFLANAMMFSIASRIWLRNDDS